MLGAGVENVVIIGSGPAGYTAAIYAARANLKLVVKCHSVIVATGATAKGLRLPREDEFWSRGISACAICDGASPLFKGQVLAVVGGGDTATEESLYLTNGDTNLLANLDSEKELLSFDSEKDCRNFDVIEVVVAFGLNHVVGDSETVWSLLGFFRGENPAEPSSSCHPSCAEL
ncbi:hypothetical protein ACLOJK_008051 [Asimina triloba]